MGGTVHGNNKAFATKDPASANRGTIVAMTRKPSTSDSDGPAGGGPGHAHVNVTRREVVTLEDEIEARLDAQIAKIVLPEGISARMIKSVLLNLVTNGGKRMQTIIGFDENLELDGGLIECLSALLTASLADGQSRFPKNLMIIVDDLQWIDDASWSLLKHMARDTYGIKIVFVLAMRDAALLDQDDAEARLFDHVCELEPLTEVDVSEIIKEEFGTDIIPNGITYQIHAATAGNPFWVTQLARRIHEKPGTG